jgi:hypothetical protein
MESVAEYLERDHELAMALYEHAAPAAAAEARAAA